MYHKVSTKENEMEIEAWAGENIAIFARRCIDEAKQKGGAVVGIFNKIRLDVNEDSYFFDIVEVYNLVLKCEALKNNGRK